MRNIVKSTSITNTVELQTVENPSDKKLVEDVQLIELASKSFVFFRRFKNQFVAYKVFVKLIYNVYMKIVICL